MYTVYCIQYKHTLNHIKFIYVLHCLSKIEMSQQSYGPSTPPASQVRKLSHSGRASRPKWLSRSSSSGHRPATHCRPHSSMLQLNIVTTCDNQMVVKCFHIFHMFYVFHTFHLAFIKNDQQKGPITSKRSWSLWSATGSIPGFGRPTASTAGSAKRSSIGWEGCLSYEKYMKCIVSHCKLAEKWQKTLKSEGSGSIKFSTGIEFQFHDGRLGRNWPILIRNTKSTPTDSSKLP